jgi:DNA polymerase-1
MNRLVLIDGHNLLFRMFYGIPRPVYNKDGKDLKTVMGFIGGVSKLAKTLKADRLLVLFDSINSTGDRIAEYEDYKANRIDYSQLPDEENPFVQLPDIYKVLDFLNIAYIEADGYEADDYIASICKKYKGDYEMLIVSTDSDFNQLVAEDVTIFNPRGQHGSFYTPEKVYEKFGVTPDQIVDYKSLVGDSADNILGVKGIGPKRAIEVLTYGTLEEILAGETELLDKYLVKIKDAEDVVKRNQLLIEMIKTVDVDLDDQVLEIKFDVNKRPMRILEECGLR